MCFRLMLVTDRTIVPLNGLPAIVGCAVEGGVDAVQLREKDLGGEELVALGRELRAVTRGRALLIVNGTVEQARDCDADGLHLPEAARRPDAACDGLIVGRSVHSVAAARRAAREGMDYLLLGTIYPSRSHPEARGAGPALIAQVCDEIERPVVAIGGITTANVADVMRAGAAGVAVVSAVLAAPDPRAGAEALARALRRALAGEAGGGR